MTDKLNPEAIRRVLSRIQERCGADEAFAMQGHIKALEQETWDLREALAQARKERNEASERAKDELAKACLAEIRRDEAVADNAALLNAAQETASIMTERDWQMRQHRAHAILAVLEQPHPGTALLEELETLRGRQVLWEEAAQSLYGYTEFLGPCAHGRDPWDRCDECGEGTSVAAAQKVIAKMAAEHRKALVHARNEGLEKAKRATLEIKDMAFAKAAQRGGAQADAWSMAGALGLDIAATIQAMKESEE